MSAIICPTVLAAGPHEFREQMARIASFANRIQIDLMDGKFAPTMSIPLDRIWWDERIQADIHLMYQSPLQYLAQLIHLKPHMVIVHFETAVPHEHFVSELKKRGIKAGLCLLKNTPVEVAKDVLPLYDHLLIFSGDLGRFGGQADILLVEKAIQAKAINPHIEVGWDGGVNAENIAALAHGGIDVLNVGGYIQNADDPSAAYESLTKLL